MKFSSASILALSALAIAAPAAAVDDDCTTTAFHGHHKHKREIVYDYAYVTVTVDINGNTIGLPATSSSTSVDPTTSSQTTETIQTTSTSTTSSSTSVATTSSSTQQSQETTGSSSGGSGGINGDLGLYQNPTEEFQDGVISCSSFPSGQGVIALNNLGFGGWSGIENSDGSTGGPCGEGSYCSYACQSGMSKTQWPSAQPANGVSIGGLLCKGGFLYKSNPSNSYLCEWGVDKATVISELSQSVAICRTDYPGTENMVIPTVVNAGGSSPLTVVDQATYYTWRGGATSAQYYVNNAGVSYTDGCIWGTAGSGIGNWAPLNFGAGYANGIAYLSLIPNPNNYDSLNFNVKIVAADSSSTVSGQCVYSNGQYNGDGTDGCTVGVTSGSANYVLYN
ncbi:putative beta-glucosidase septation protein SUN4 precursor SIM1 [Scheffersomyces coipomensis]|uniref:putative beta-glucosidase septation protein SUN4 precursor SIM1 n=1 Tax=Scheffersomyces coipomensis TaxID=1788519 RepID=UPI00315DBF65